MDTGPVYRSHLTRNWLKEKNLAMELIDAIELIIKSVRAKSDLTPEEKNACDVLEDWAVNQMGDE